MSGETQVGASEASEKLDDASDSIAVCAVSITALVLVFSLSLGAAGSGWNTPGTSEISH